MKYCLNFEIAIEYARNYLINTGQVITTESWQGVKKPIEMFESFDLAFKCPIPDQISRLKAEIQPNLPWADEHFAERVSGIPYNPPPSNEHWPFATNNNGAHKEPNHRFSHTYPERFWPKHAGDLMEGHLYQSNKDWINNQSPTNTGIWFNYGDLDDVINLLHKEPHTRQAYLPIWFPEDTGAVEGQRVPCTLGYLFRVINNHLHITYKIRSCDYFRHFRDDIYMASLLVFHILGELRGKSKEWLLINPGLFKFQADSFHVFGLEKDKL